MYIWDDSTGVDPAEYRGNDYLDDEDMASMVEREEAAYQQSVVLDLINDNRVRR